MVEGEPIFEPVVPHELHTYFILHEKSPYWENEQARFLPTVVGTRG